MKRPAADASWTAAGIRRTLGISPSVIAGLVRAGFVHPARGPRGEYRFGFQDVVLLRTAHALRAAHIPQQKILRTLARLNAALPAELPLSSVRLTALGSGLVVREGDAHREVESGQLLFDFAPAPPVAFQRAVAFTPQAPALPPAPDLANGAADCFVHGVRLEEADPAAAEAAYREALRLDPEYADAYLNLGAMLCEAGRCKEAVRLYDEAVLHRPEVAFVHFNRAIALEDVGRTADALASYEACLRLAPETADAHFNAARLMEQQGRDREALQHLSAYRRLGR